MKPKSIKNILVASLLLSVFLFQGLRSYALDFYDYKRLQITPIPCKTRDMTNAGIALADGGVCTLPLKSDISNETFQGFYEKDNAALWGDSYNKRKTQLRDDGLLQDIESLSESCATTFTKDPTVTPGAVGSEIYDAPFDEDPRLRHYWAEDQEVTALGKSNERARQFVYWVVSRSAIDQALSLKQVWGLSRNVAISFMIIVTSVFGLAIIVSRKLRSGYKFSVQSSLVKIALSALFIVLSASIVFVLISLSEIIMKFFIESLGGDRVFNTYFATTSNESNYIGFIGCRDLNIRVKDAADTSIFLLKLTNITYYMMGVMLILRKILLWFLLFVSPFLPLLLSFPLVRNTGRIWIGVFFQWLFYGPLFALFFGATARLFSSGIPFGFDFSRIEKTIGYIFPTAIIVTYGGPGQKSSGLNNGNYIDTFVEYVIALILWWAVTWFPWWLLRIYRDDCCDAIYSMRNALFGVMDKLTQKPPVTHPEGPTPISPKTPQPPRFDIITPKTTPRETIQKLRLDNPSVVRQSKTETIVNAMSLQATTLKDIARLETNKETASVVKQNLALLENPLSASTTTDRQTYLNVRTELFTRASTRNDIFAQRILSTTNRASQTYINKRNELTKSVETIVSKMNEQNVVNLTKSVADTSKVSEQNVIQNTNTVINNITNNHSALQAISAGSRVESHTVKQILQNYAKNIDKPFTVVVSKISESTQVSTEKVKEVLKETQTLIKRSQSVGRLAQTVIPDRVHARELLTQVDKLMTSVSEKASMMGSQMIVKISQLILNIIQSSPNVVSEIAQKTNTTSEEIKKTLETVSRQQTINNETLKKIVEETNIPREKIQDIVVEAAKVVQSQAPMSVGDTGDTPLDAIVKSTLASGVSMEATAPVVSVLSSELEKVFADEKVSEITKEVLKHTIQDEQLVTTIQEQTGLSKKQVTQTLEALSQSATITDEQTLKDLTTNAGVEKVKALQVVREAMKQANAAKSVTTPEDGTPEGDVEITRMLEDQLEMALNPESQIDQAIPLDPASIDEYEEIRKLWIEQYKTGEVPVSDDIHSRLDWVTQDLDLITNVLRKLVSKDEKQRQQALDEIGFILPIFLMNNLSGNQLITYLKAKAAQLEK
ncbi:MAG: hypothetical protein U0525_04095 [Patescibacteria group bacterium]